MKISDTYGSGVIAYWSVASEGETHSWHVDICRKTHRRFQFRTAMGMLYDIIICLGYTVNSYRTGTLKSKPFSSLSLGTPDDSRIFFVLEYIIKLYHMLMSLSFHVHIPTKFLACVPA